MAKKRKSLLELFQDKLKVLLSADELFLESIKATEGSLFSSIINFLRSFTQEDGRLVSDERSDELMGSIKKEVRTILKDSTLPKKVDQFLPSFDQVEKLNKEIYGRIVGPNAKLPPVGSAKRSNIEKVVRGLKDIKGIEPVFEIPLRQRLFQMVETQTQFTDAVDGIRVFVKGTSPSGGTLARYARQIATDLLNGFNGYQEQEIARANGLDGFFYTGSLIATSRQTCIDLSGGIGEYEDLTIRPGLYPVSAIPKIVQRSDDNPGWRPETTSDTFAIYRGGYNCRHLLVFVPLTKKEQAKVDDIMGQLEPIREFDPTVPDQVVPPAGPPEPDPNVPGGNQFVWDTEKDLVPLDKERGLIFDSLDSSVEWSKGGQVSSIRIDRDAARLMEGRIFTHNHPSWKKRQDKRGSSFSIDDVITRNQNDRGQMSGDIIIAYRNGLKEMRAVSQNDTFIFRPDISGEHWISDRIPGLTKLDQRTDILQDPAGREFKRSSIKYDFGKIDEIDNYRDRQFARQLYYEKVIRPKIRKGFDAFQERMFKWDTETSELRTLINKHREKGNKLFDEFFDKLGGKEFSELMKKEVARTRLLEDALLEREFKRRSFWTHWQMEDIAKEIPGEYIHINESRK